MKNSRQMIFEEQAFWLFSTNFYAIPKHQQALILLQDHAQLNVNLALLILFSGLNGCSFNELEINALRKSIQQLDSLTLKIREQRRAYKLSQISAGVSEYRDANYKSFLAQELTLEKRQQSTLIQTVRAFNDNRKTTEIDNADVNVWVSNTINALLTPDTAYLSAINSSCDLVLSGLSTFVERPPT